MRCKCRDCLYNVDGFCQDQSCIEIDEDGCCAACVLLEVEEDKHD